MYVRAFTYGPPDTMPRPSPWRAHRERLARARELARTAVRSLDDDQICDLAEALVARMHAYRPTSPEYGRYRTCIAELHAPLVQAVSAAWAADSPDVGMPDARRPVRRGLLRALDTYVPGGPGSLRHHVLAAIRVEIDAAHRGT